MIGRWFPPVPTYLGAFAGGAVATCAAGAATFKYGTVREWVDGLTIVLAGGDVLELSRGECRATDGGFTIETASGERSVKLPDLRMPDVPKRSAGYHIAPDMDSDRSLHRIRRHARRDRRGDVQDRAAAGRAVPRVGAGSVRGTCDRARRRAAGGGDRDMARPRSARHRHLRDRAHRRPIDRRDSRGRHRSQTRRRAAVWFGGGVADRPRVVA